jgi:hypothetical protein
MTLGVSGVKADYKEGVVVAVVVEPSYRETGGACLGGLDQVGFTLLEVVGVVDGGAGGLGQERLRRDECSEKDDASKHSDSLGQSDCNWWVGLCEEVTDQEPVSGSQKMLELVADLSSNEPDRVLACSKLDKMIKRCDG